MRSKISLEIIRGKKFKFRCILSSLSYKTWKGTTSTKSSVYRTMYLSSLFTSFCTVFEMSIAFCESATPSSEKITKILQIIRFFGNSWSCRREFRLFKCKSDVYFGQSLFMTSGELSTSPECSRTS